MGFLKGFLNREGPKPPEATETQKPDKTKETKPAAEVGRERVEKIIDAVKSSWTKLRGKLSSGLERTKNGIVDLTQIVVGGTEKGVGASVKGVKAGAEGTVAAGRYMKESAQEAYDLGKLGVEIGAAAGKKGLEAGVAAGKKGVEVTKDVALAVGAAGILVGAAGALLTVELGKKGIEIGSKTGKEIASATKALAEMGVDAGAAIKTFGVEKIVQTKDLAVRAKEAGIDLGLKGAIAVLEAAAVLEERGIIIKDAVKGKGKEYFQKGVDIYSGAKEKARDIALKGKKAYDKAAGRIKTARVSFNEWRYSKASLELKNAELTGEVEELKEERRRLLAMIETNSALNPAEPENMVYEDEEETQTERTRSVA